MTDQELITGLDACRPASDDLRQPELSKYAEQLALDNRAREIRVRIERVDGAVLRAMHDLPLPEGFTGRLLARLKEAEHAAPRETVVGDAVRAELAPARAGVTPAVQDTKRSRRQLLAWSIGLATAAAATVVAVLLLRPDTPLVRDDLESSRQWHEQLAADGRWRPIEPEELEQHALPSELRQSPRRFRDASSVVGREAWAYDLTLPGRPQATLFVIAQTERAGVPSSPPRTPFSTQGLAVAYWQTGGYIYVVVLESDRGEDYRRLFNVGAVPAVA